MSTPPVSRRIITLVLSALLAAGAMVAAGQPAHPPARRATPKPAFKFPWQLSPAERARLDRLTNEDHANMMAQLGITRLRPGRNPNLPPGWPGAPNYDQARANPYPNYPDPLTLPGGRKVTTPAAWRDVRRPQLVELFAGEMYGRIPQDAPKIGWRVARTLDTTVGGHPVRARLVIGHIDNSADPAIKVDVRMAVVTPSGEDRPVPVLIMFGFGNMPDERIPRFGTPPPVPPSTEQLIADGWGYVSLDPMSVQPDNGAGLREGIIGLTNHGHFRKPGDWGALRAWGWGASRALDYLATDPSIDANRVGIEGVSRFGKAALVTMAFDRRFAVALLGSSGEGGVKPSRRNFGEALENLTGGGGYHWMAGNFLKYGAAESKFGVKTANDLPVESNELIALCAPRPVFVSYGIPARGDANWLDHQGSFMATVAAGEVYRLLGAKDLGVTEDYHTAKKPPVNHGLLDGDLAWRQHDGGHEDTSNMSYFIAWADRELGWHRTEARSGR